jgi:hypothetical protein
MEGRIDEKEDLIFETKLELFSIGIITISNEIVSLLTIEVSNININGEFEREQRISYQGIAKLVASTKQKKEFNVKLEISLEDKVYPKTYYHHNQANIEVDETIVKI